MARVSSFIAVLAIATILEMPVTSWGAPTNEPLTVATIAGFYTVRGHGWFAHETIDLHGDSFEYCYRTDALPEPKPISGHFELDGCLLTLQMSTSRFDHRLITKTGGTLIMWTPKQYEEYLRTRKIPEDVLYRSKKD
jgi:hypothetical protein